MHRAVAARLANPDLTLFEALRMGGFEYPTNDDASVMDAEKVTLGQRKNQLSRRLRLARKQTNSKDYQHGDHGSGHIGGSTANFGSGHSTGGNSVGGNSRGGGNSRTSNASSGGLSSEAQKELQKLMQHSRNAKMSSSVVGPGASSSKRDAGALLDDDIENETGETPVTMEIQEEPKRARIAKFHPDYAPLFVPPPRNAFGSSTGGVPGATPAVNPSFQHQPQQTQQLPTAGMPSLSMGAAAAATLGSPVPGAIGGNTFGGASALFSQAGMFPSQAGGQTGARPSAVAVASLTATAQSVGMTLEQLAVSLGSSPSNLAKVLTSLNSNNADTMAKQLNLALNLFQAESRALYSRCMLLAGIPQNQCQESSPTHLQFALNAWQMEGKRLKDLLANSPSSRGAINLDTQLDQISGTGSSHRHKSTTRRGSGGNDSVSTSNNADRGGLDSASHSHEDEHGDDLDDMHHSHGNAEGEGNAGRNRRHLHRLEGKCGHKAILHQPKDGTPHIDFVVGSHVECYHGIDAVSTNSNLAWPSKFTCDDVGGCSSECGSDAPPISKSKNVVPKTIHLSQIDWSDPEWNKDVSGGSVEGSVARFFKRDEPNDSLAL